MIESQPCDSILLAVILALNFSSYFYNYNLWLLLSWFAGPEPPATLGPTGLKVSLSRNSDPGNIISTGSPVVLAEGITSQQFLAFPQISLRDEDVDVDVN